MIDFQNASYLKLKPVNDKAFADIVTPMFVPGEKIIGTYQSIRDGVVFTNKRIITINVQGLTGKKRTSLLFRTAKFRRTPLKLPEYWIWTANLNSGFLA